MRLIQPDETRRCAEILQAHSWDAAASELHEADITDPVRDELLPIKGYVEIRCRSMDRWREYPTGDGIAWVSGFERDLLAGRFP